MVKNLPSITGDRGSIPGWGTQIPLAIGQLSLCSATKILHNQINKWKECPPTLLKGSWVLRQIPAGSSYDMTFLVLSKVQGLLLGKWVAGRMLCQDRGAQRPWETPTRPCCCSVSKFVWLFATLWTAACQASLSFTVSWRLHKFISIESVMLSNHLILCRPLHLLPSIFPSIRGFSNDLPLRIRWPKYWSFSYQA